MKLFLSKEVVTTDKETAVWAVLNGMYSSKQERLLVSVAFIGYTMCGHFLKSEKRQERTILEGIREAIKGLVEKNIIEIVDQDKDNYVLSGKGLDIDTSKERFVVIELWELQKIFQAASKPFNLFTFFAELIGTVNNKTKEWHFSQDQMIEYWGYGKETVNSYMKQLEEMQLIYVYRHRERRADGTYHKINNSYGRYADKDAIIAEAVSYAGLIETEEFMEKTDRRTIKLRYNAFCKGSKKYIDNPSAVEKLYDECVQYNKSLKYKPIEGTYAGGYKEGAELDLSVFPAHYIEEMCNDEDIWGEPNAMEIPAMAQGVDSCYFLSILQKVGDNMRHSGVHYNYDMAESNWIIKQGAKVIGCGRHSTTGNTFLVFQATDLYKKLCEEYRAKHST